MYHSKTQVFDTKLNPISKRIMKKILQTPLFVLIGLVILSLTIFLCGLNISSETISAIITAIYIPLTIYLIIISINTSREAMNVSLLQNLYNDYHSRILYLEQENRKETLFHRIDMDGISKYYEIKYNPTIDNAPNYIKEIIHKIKNCNSKIISDYTEILDDRVVVKSEYVNEIREFKEVQATLSVKLMGFEFIYDYLSSFCDEIHKSELHHLQKQALVKRIKEISKYYVYGWSKLLGKNETGEDSEMICNFLSIWNENGTWMIEEGRPVIGMIDAYLKLADIFKKYDN